VSEASRASGRRPNQGRVGTVVNGKWQIDARIGSGGMATVYAATHRNGHRAALKMLHTQLSRDDSTRARFLREGYVANAVGHPGVVHVEDDGVSEDGAAFLVLELLEGETLEARRTRLGGMLQLHDVLDVADSVLDVLRAAHEKGIVHRDVKPDNVFITWDNQVKLLDFGLARMKHAQVEVTKTGVTIGTPEFMAPEQAQGKRDEVDALSDMWALGATLFMALTGKYVHDAINLHEQLVASATKRARSISALAKHVPPSVAIVIDRALELDKKDRWESALEMQRALRAARAPRIDSDRSMAESLTLPAASPASLRRGPIPESGPRPSNRGLIPSSGSTLEMLAPQSDPTIEDAAPITIHLEDLPTSSDGPMSPVPTTERLTGTGGRAGGAILQAQSQHAQAIAEALGQPPANHQSTQELTGPPRPVPMRHDSTLTSSLGSSPPPQPAPPAFGSGAHAALSSGGAPPQLGSGQHPSLQGRHPSTLSSMSSGGQVSFDAQTELAVPTGSGLPPPPLHQAPPMHHHPSAPTDAPALPSPVSLRVRRSSRRVVIVSVLLILVCAGIGAWVLFHPTLAMLRRY
jgi:eukaryotic-like serine/threonine-protein kinase